MNTNKRQCDGCKVELDGQCYVDGALLLCADCAENLEMEREFGGPMDDDFGDYDMNMDSYDY